MWYTCHKRATRINFVDSQRLRGKPKVSSLSTPLILREKGYEFSFVMFDLGEPIHVHVRHGHKQAKFWVDPIAVAWMRGYRTYEINEIERIIRANKDLIREVWQQESDKRS